MEATLSMGTQIDRSEKVTLKLGPTLRKDPSSERRVSQGEGTVTVQARRWLEVAVFGEQKETQCARGAVWEGETSVQRRPEERTWLICAGF